MLGSVVRTFVFVLCFLVLSVLLHLVTAGIDKVLSDAPMSAIKMAASAMKLRKSPRFAPNTMPSTNTSAKATSIIRPLFTFLALLSSHNL